MAEEKNVQNLNWEDRLTNFEHWVNENKKVLTYVVGGLFAIVAAYLGFMKFYVTPKSTEANNQIFIINIS